MNKPYLHFSFASPRSSRNRSSSANGECLSIFYFVSYKLAVLNIEIIPFQISFNNLTTLTGIALQDPGNSAGLVEKFNISYAISNDAPQDQDFNYTYVSIISKIWKSTLIYNGVT